MVGQSTGKRSERIHVSTSLVVYQREIGAQHQRLKSMSIKVILGNEIVHMTLYYLNEAARALYFDDAAPPPPPPEISARRDQLHLPVFITTYPQQ